MKRHVLAALAVAGTLVGVVFPAGAYPGDLDPSFGWSGSVNLTPPGGSRVTASSPILQGDGKLVVTFDGVRNAFAVRRYLTDGSLDDTFGAGGTAAAPDDYAGAPDHYATAAAAGAALQPDGKIVVVGHADTPDCSPFTYTNCAYPKGIVRGFGLARFAADGSLDLGFGSPDHGFSGDSTGTVRTLFNGQGAAAHAVVVLPDGKIVAAGMAGVGTTNHIAVARYNPDGSADPSFGEGGTVTTPVGASSNASSVLVEPGGKLVVAGSTSDPGAGTGAFALARYNSDGTLDTSFGTTGTVTTTIGALSGASSAVLQPDGAIVAAGFTRPDGNPNTNIALARYHPDGTLDNAFGNHGTVTTAAGTASEANGVVLQPDGTFVAAGSISSDGSSPRRKLALVLYKANGAPGTGFGHGGKVTAAVNSDGDVAYGVVLQPDGKLIGVGTSLMRFAGSQGATAVHTRITMTAPKKVTYGQTITYTVKVANTGTASAHNVTVTVVPPPGVDTPSAMTPASQCALVRQDRAAMGRDAVVCNLGTLTTQSAATVTVTVKPLYVQHSPFKGEAYDTTTDREMSPTSSTHAKASVKVACPPQGPCNVQ